MNNQFRRDSQTTWQIFRWPTLICVLSIVGLVTALVGDGWWDAVSWGSLGSIVLLMLVAYNA